jgi:hypothetical protein
MTGLNTFDSVLIGATVGSCGLYLIVTKAQAQAPLLSSGDLGAVQALMVLLVFQLVLLVCLRWGRGLVVVYLLLALVIGLSFGAAAPQVVNREFAGVESEGPDLEVLHWNKDGKAPMLRLRTVDSTEPGEWYVVPWDGYWNRSYGEVVRLVDVEGALGGTWRRAVVHQDRTSAGGWDQIGWKALKAKDWNKCVDATTSSLELRPSGDRGRILHNRARCFWELDDQDAAIEDLRVACSMGAPKTCQQHERSVMVRARGLR